MVLHLLKHSAKHHHLEEDQAVIIVFDDKVFAKSIDNRIVSI